MNASIRSEEIESTTEKKSTAISPRSRKSRPASATSCATTSPICAGAPADEPGNRAARAEHRGHRQQRQFADPARRRNLARRNREADLGAGKPARPAARRRPARPARDLGLCPAQPGRDEIDADDRRQRHAVETRRRRPAQQLIRCQYPRAAASRNGGGGFHLGRFRAKRTPLRVRKARQNNCLYLKFFEL